jgi:hypothetical protein
MVLLRREYGVTSREYLQEMPWWEADLLVAAARESVEGVV